MEMLTLQCGQSSLVLAPEFGGAIVGWMRGNAALLRRSVPDAIVAGNVRGLGCFPLVPFSNRIAQGRFRWEGVEYQLDRNFGDHPHTIHGVGWKRAWEVASAGATSATLTLRHDAVGDQARRWPFAFAAAQRFTLSADALHVATVLRNLHSSPAPAGMGLHPYLPRAGGATLWFDAAPCGEVRIRCRRNWCRFQPSGATSADGASATLRSTTASSGGTASSASPGHPAIPR
jgi:aldose 1-epimerase